jgi:hypothetical protein
MRLLAISGILAVSLSWTAQAQEATLWNKLIDVSLEHIKAHGPDAQTGQFIGIAGEHAWLRRQELVELVIPHLKGTNAVKIAGALDVLYALRNYRPIIYSDNSEKDSQAFFLELDKTIYSHLEQLHSLQSDTVYHRLALYLSCSATAESKQHLLHIATSPTAKAGKEQALICLAWHCDPKDMDSLLPFMLKESDAVWNLPYHFRNSYGQAAIPYLKQALAKAQSSMIRQRTAYELVHLRIPEGFSYLQRVALADPEPEERTRPRPLHGIRQFATDYLNLPGDFSTPAAIAAHIAKKERELCTLKYPAEKMSNQEIQPPK